jgi:hypothetical protein
MAADDSANGKLAAATLPILYSTRPIQEGSQA